MEVEFNNHTGFIEWMGHVKIVEKSQKTKDTNNTQMCYNWMCLGMQTRNPHHTGIPIPIPV